MQTWYVYLLQCADNSLYCGITTDPARRLEQHNGLRPGGARYTRGRRPVILYASTLCADRSAALRLEERIKALPRQRKLAALQTASAEEGEHGAKLSAHQPSHKDLP